MGDELINRPHPRDSVARWQTYATYLEAKLLEVRPLTERERDAIVGLVAAIANDGLDTYGLSSQQQAAVHRALGKLTQKPKE